MENNILYAACTTLAWISAIKLIKKTTQDSSTTWETNLYWASHFWNGIRSQSIGNWRKWLLFGKRTDTLITQKSAQMKFNPNWWGALCSTNKLLDDHLIIEAAEVVNDRNIIINYKSLYMYLNNNLNLSVHIWTYTYTSYFFWISAFGAVPSPFDCFLVNRGLKTLHVRMKEHMKNGLAVARFLEKHPLVTKVIHPG